jgi:iron-sulfur cluster repair protein YtfE (RIC family)
MEPSEIRSRILGDHGRLRRDLDQLEALAAAVREGRASSEVLRLDVEALVARLRVHMRWEESYLLPALHDSDAWGVERAERLVADHREQRELLDFVTARSRSVSQPEALLDRDVVHLIALLRDDMREEETDLLDERVLRDDVVAIDASSG